MLSTNLKIAGAKVIYRILLMLGIIGDDSIRINRNGLKYEIDPSEGIDLSIFLFGQFERNTFKLYTKLLSEIKEPVIIDIGANIGSHTVPFIQIAEKNKGLVFAFEPTQYAYNKLIRNIELNDFDNRYFKTLQAFVGCDEESPNPTIYSSWPLNSKAASLSTFGGDLKSTIGATNISLDMYLEEQNVRKK